MHKTCKTKRRSAGALALALAVTALLVPAAADADRAPELARVDPGPAGVAFEPLEVHDGMTLTVAGGGMSLTRRYGAAESPFVNLVDAAGKPLADGIYKWELRAEPPALALNRERFEHARAAADGDAMIEAQAPRMAVQSGVFTIKHGTLVDSSLVEAEGVQGDADAGGVETIRESGAPVDADGAGGAEN